jgi:hypothetical protein
MRWVVVLVCLVSTATQAKEQRCGYVDHAGRMIIGQTFSSAYAFSEGLARVREGPKFGFIDLQGKPIVKPKFDQAGDFNSGLARVQGRGKWGFVDRTGRLVVPLQFSDAHDFVENRAETRALVALGGEWAGLDSEGGPTLVGAKYGFVDLSGKVAVPIRFDYAVDFRAGAARVTEGSAVSYVDANGKPCAKPPDAAESWPEGLTPIGRGDRAGYENAKHELVGPLIFATTERFSDGLGLVRLPGPQGKFGYVAPDGHYAVPPRFDTAQSFSEGLAMASEGGEVGFINKAGQFVFKLKAPSSVGNFSDGRALVCSEE